MKVKLTYFKTTGKYYSEGECETNKEHLHEIFRDIRILSDYKKLPGLVEGHSDFITLIDVPEHKHNHPHLIIKD